MKLRQNFGIFWPKPKPKLKNGRSWPKPKPKLRSIHDNVYKSHIELIIVDTSDVDAWLANTIFQEVMPNLDKIVEEWELIRAKVD